MDSKILFANNARTRVTKEVKLSDTVLSITAGDADVFPSPSAFGEYFIVRIDNPTTGTFEILKVIEKRTDSFVVERAQEGTTAKYFPEGSLIQNTLTAGSLEHLLNSAIATTEEVGLVRLATDDEIKEGVSSGDLPAVATVEQVFKSGVIKGSIIAFSGSFGGKNNVYPIPEGETAPNTNWRLCDGGDGTPDLRGKFILGASDEYPVESTGGSNSITIDLIEPTTLTINQMPAHSHPEHLASNTGVGYQGGGWGIVGRDHSGYNTWNTGGGQAHTHSIKPTNNSNMPPYYALAYIKRIK